jgi:LCP family protein required for cell wall assembly
MKRRRRRSGKRVLLLLVIVAGLIYAGAHILIRQPEVKAQEDPDPVEETEDLTQEEQDSAAAAAAHTERKEQFYTILVSGCDDGNGNSDTNILLAVDAKNGYIHGVSIPRDTKAVWGGNSHKINAAFGSGGIEKLAEVIGDQLGIPVDFTVSVDLKGFVALVDAIGGVDFDVPVNMDYEDPYQDLYIHIPAGMQHLSGEEALKVVRFREGYASQDIGRMEPQQKFLKAVAQQTLTLSNLDKIPEFANIFNQYVKTDLTLGNLAWLGKEAISMGSGAISFSTLPGEWKSPYIYLDRDAVLELVNQYLNPYAEDRTAEDLNIPPEVPFRQPSGPQRRHAMKTRILSLALAASLLLGVSALAAENSTGNFIREKTYSGQFSDLTADSTFYDNVAALYEYGLSVGKTDGTFGLRDSLTVGQIVIFAGRIRSLYRTGDAEAGPSAHSKAGDTSTAARYLRYLQAEGVLDTELDGSLTAPATRAQVAHVLANTLPSEVLPSINEELVTEGYASRKFITDVTEYTDYYRDILFLYRTGISVGSDATGSYLPQEPITRGAAAAMLTRMEDPALRADPRLGPGQRRERRGTTQGRSGDGGHLYSRPHHGGRDRLQRPLYAGLQPEHPAPAI